MSFIAGDRVSTPLGEGIICGVIAGVAHVSIEGEGLSSFQLRDVSIVSSAKPILRGDPEVVLDFSVEKAAPPVVEKESEECVVVAEGDIIDKVVLDDLEAREIVIKKKTDKGDVTATISVVVPAVPRIMSPKWLKERTPEELQTVLDNTKLTAPRRRTIRKELKRRAPDND